MTRVEFTGSPRRRPVARGIGVALVVAVATSASVSGTVPGLRPAPAVAQVVHEQRYRPPVDAPVIDPFRPPPMPWGPGNRGLEYGTVAGTLVRAIGPGLVSFSGPVAGTLHVTVTHPDGLRSSYSGVAALRVSAGDLVDGGQVVAVSATTLHLGVRDGERYVDPSALWGLVVAAGPVVLVPVAVPPPAAGPYPERLRRAPAAVARVLSRLRLGPWAG